MLQKLDVPTTQEHIVLVCEEFKAHLDAEEEACAIAGIQPPGGRQSAELLIDRLADEKPRSASYHRTIRELSAAIRSHTTGPFPAIEGADLGKRIAQRKEQLRHSLDAESTAFRITGGTNMNAVTLLSEDHEKVRRLLSEIEQAQPQEATVLLAQLEQEIRLHTTAEEELFYPAMRELADNDEDKQQVGEAYEEHHAVDVLFMEIKQVDPGTDQFKAKLGVLKDMIEHHAQEEEQEMFPKARTGFTNEELANLGTELARFKQELERSYPAMDRGFTQAKTAGAAARRSR